MNPKPYIVLYGTYKKTEVFGKHLSNHSFVAFTSFWRLSCSRIVQLHYWQQFLILETLKIYKLRPNEQLLLLPHLLVLPHFPLGSFSLISTGFRCKITRFLRNGAAGKINSLSNCFVLVCAGGLQ